MAWRDEALNCPNTVPPFNGTVEQALEEIIGLALSAADPPLTAVKRERVIYLANECIYHAVDDLLVPYTQVDHSTDVCEALQAAQNGDWGVCINELEHLGNTGDIVVEAEVEAATWEMAYCIARGRTRMDIIMEMIRDKVPVVLHTLPGPKVPPKPKKPPG